VAFIARSKKDEEKNLTQRTQRAQKRLWSRVDSGIAGGLAGALATFFANRILLKVILLENVEKKGVRRLSRYFMGYYTIWLALVKRNFGSVLGIREEKSGVASR
jgi:hypothetical protein